MQTDCKSIGVLGGTFNPVHNGHVEIAVSVAERFHLDRVLFIPSGKPPHKSRSEVAEGRHRLEMVRRAVLGHEKLEVSAMEIERNGYTYTVDTLRQLKGIYGGDCTIFFIIGADIISELTTWKDTSNVFSLCEFIAVLRPGYSREAFRDEIEGLEKEHGAMIHTANAPLVDVSSTQIRERVAEGLSIRGLVPAGVEEYIREQGLYL